MAAGRAKGRARGTKSWGRLSASLVWEIEASRTAMRSVIERSRVGLESQEERRSATNALAPAAYSSAAPYRPARARLPIFQMALRPRTATLVHFSAACRRVAARGQTREKTLTILAPVAGVR